MAAQRSIDSLTPSRAVSHAGGRESALEQGDALRRVALGFQAVVRATRQDPLVARALSAERSSLGLAVAEYAALRRQCCATPEQALISVKAVTSALSTGIDPATADILGHMVLQAFLAGYYGEGMRTRSAPRADANVRMR